MSVVFPRRNPTRKPVEALRAGYGDDYYICRFQEVVVLEGVAHFLHEEKPEVINNHILDFFHKFSASSSCCVG
ncbi:hypothetical protein Vadar_027582 [Vaccinium darrowii]|uniref:Uncharacterized protein n=1 Tax=Vaccinium darrowii TaxID=229202 RepID=A0ACB7XTS1_9ERIC|nr:hypothetical protein Vadar_027582 [Vaccinium darrowii]